MDEHEGPLDALYEGPSEGVRFRAFLAALRRTLGAEATVLMLHPPTRSDAG